MPGDIFRYISELSYLFFLPIPPQAPSFSSSSIQNLPNQINPNHTPTHYLNYISHPHTQPSPAPPVLPKPPLGSATMLATWGYKAYKKHQEKKRLARLSEPGQSPEEVSRKSSFHQSQQTQPTQQSPQSSATARQQKLQTYEIEGRRSGEEEMESKSGERERQGV